MTQLAGGLALHHLSRIPGGILVEGRSTVGRTEVVTGALVLQLLIGGGWIDAHTTNRVSDQLGPRLGSACVSSHHVQAASCEKAPGHHRHQDQECDVEEGRVVPGWLGLENRDMVVCRSKTEQLECAANQETGERHC